MLHVFRRHNIDNIAIEFQSWLEYLDGIDRPIQIHSPNDELLDDALVMGDDPSGTVKTTRAKRFTNVGFFQYADERGFKMGYKHYGSPELRYVLRNYYLPQHFSNQDYNHKLVYIPVGSHSHIRPVPPSALVPASKRTLRCNFYGSISSGNTERNEARKALMKQLRSLGNPCEAKLQGRFGGDIKPMHFAFKLRNSRFTLCPRGHAEETIRLFDAMACGSIPVVLRGYKFLEELSVWRGHPFVVLDDWSQLVERMAKIEANPKEMDALQVEGWLSFGGSFSSRQHKNSDG